ncbi:MAG: PAS domain-containing protein, partial [Candidatus Zixiibacteriota bacterium]
MTEVSKDELQRLRESEEKYRRMIELSTDAIFAIDAADGRILEVNPRTEEMLGMTSGELVGLKIWELHAQDEQMAARELFRNTLKHGSGSHAEMTLVHADGSPVWVDISASVVTYGNMTVIQRICRDVSVRRRLEIANRELRKYYEHVLDMMPVGLGVKKGVGKSPSVEFENRKLKEMLGGEDKAHHWCWGTCADVTGKFENGSYVEEQTWPDGRVFQMTSSYYRDPDNTWRELQVIQDITERRHLQDELRRANEH